MTIKVWSWRQAIAKAKLEPSTKLVLYTLANYMNEHGTGCYPTQEMISEDSGMSLRTVWAHLVKAQEAGFIEAKKHGFGGQNWANNEYRARFPEDVEVGNPSPPNRGGTATPVAEIAHATIASPSGEGHATDDKKVTQPLRTNSPLDLSNRLEGAQARETGIDFDEVMQEIITQFRLALTQAFGREVGDKWVTTAKAKAEARRYAVKGLRAETAFKLFLGTMEKMRIDGKDPPYSLKFFNDHVEKLLTVPKRLPPPKAVSPELARLNAEWREAFNANDRERMRTISAAQEKLKQELGHG